MIFKKLPFLAALAALALGGCASTDRTYGAAPEVEVADLTSLPEPEMIEFYTLGPQEKVEIAVIGAESLSGTFLTDRNGNIDYPLLGVVAVGGLSPDEAARMIADGLRGRYLRDPQVRLIPSELPGSTISVGGQVNRPGTYEVPGKLTLLRAVNQAGGLGEYAQDDDVLVMRTIDGQSYIGLYNLGAIQRGNYADPAVYPNDIVMVGDSPGRRRIDRIVGTLAPILSTSAVILNVLTR